MRTAPVNDRPRRVCPSCGYVYFTDPKVGVGVAVVDGGRLLLVKRSMNPGRGRWSLPAGFLDQGEDPRETAIRETREETGILVVIEDVLDVFFNPPDIGGASIFVLYRATQIGGSLVAGDDAEDAGFFSLDQLPELAFESTRVAVRHLLQ
ncbi:MAG: NUDIX domain-containing protein [Chloroflexota bacterium]|jgi:8-oxo-dGTP diphosphatase